VNDLTGGADERMAQLERLDAASLTTDWLRRQLELTLAAWGSDETELDVERESRVDY